MESNNMTPEYKSALVDLLFQLADDDFIHAYRGSEWLGLAPHIEEDVAFSSISQDTMGHSAMFYYLLEELGKGNADDLAHGRQSADRKNAILLEMKNGSGHYMKLPKYDWAFAVVRNYFYVTAKYIRIQSLKNSSYEPLAQVSNKVLMELHYHLLHWKTWFYQLLTSNEEAKTKMNDAIEKVYKDLGGLFDYGKGAKAIISSKLIEDEETIRKNWKSLIAPVLESVSIALPETLEMKNGNGRNGEHTEELDEAILVLSEVYTEIPSVVW